MNILVTGANGFIGKNLVTTLYNIREKKDKSFGINSEINIFEYDVDSDEQLLSEYCRKADFVFHLAGVNRPLEVEEYMEGNYGFTSALLQLLKEHHNPCPIMLASSIQAELDNPYGHSKKAGEDLMFQYGKENDVKIYVYRFPNVFGKWCRPNYNSVVATFCYNIAHDLPIQVNDENRIMQLVYIDDVIAELIRALQENPTQAEDGFCRVPVEHKVSLGNLASLLKEFKEYRETKGLPYSAEGSFEKKLYATYLSYIPEKKFSYPLKMNIDERGSFTEIFRTEDRGQFSVNISKPGVKKGEHWHHTKNEKFIVVSGKGVLQFRKIGLNPETGEDYPMIEYHVSGEGLEIIDIPTGYTHNIINEGDEDLVTFIWCNECFDLDKPDTYYLEVGGEKNE